MGIIARATRSCSHMCCCNRGACARVFSVESSVKRGRFGEKFHPDVVTVGSRNQIFTTFGDGNEEEP